MEVTAHKTMSGYPRGLGHSLSFGGSAFFREENPRILQQNSQVYLLRLSLKLTCRVVIMAYVPAWISWSMSSHVQMLSIYSQEGMVERWQMASSSSGQAY